MNPIDLLADPEINDVLVNSTSAIQVEGSSGLRNTEFHFESEEELKLFARELIQSNGSRVDLSKPFAEVTIKSEYGLLRIHCILGGECSIGTQLSIRRHSVQSLTLRHLLDTRFLNSVQLSLLGKIVAGKQNFVIAGATGSGKTTLLRAMLLEITDERIITIEDSRELNLANAVSLFTRTNNHEGVGEISLNQLLREALRMRPDRIVIGEARGEELAVLLQALNTGHSGAGFTIHANSADEVVARMLAMLASGNIQPGLGRMMITSSVDYVIYLGKAPARQVLSIQRLGSNE